MNESGKRLKEDVVNVEVEEEEEKESEIGQNRIVFSHDGDAVVTNQNN